MVNRSNAYNFIRSLLQDKGWATKEFMLRQIGGDGRLLAEIIERLLHEHVAVEERDGLSLRYIPAPENEQASPKFKAVVVGMAVMDAIFKIPGDLPDRDQSVQVMTFGLHPGGKGLVQAVAAARLGMEVDLIAALGNDTFADTITTYLEQEKVGTTLLKRVGPPTHSLAQNTPVTGVVKFNATGESMAFGWKNETKVRLTEEHLEEPAIKTALQSADVVFITFEVADVDMLKKTINIAVQPLSSPRRPLIVVTPAPPFNSGPMVRETLEKIDFIIALKWELEELLPKSRFTLAPVPLKDLPAKELALKLKQYGGVGCVCIVDKLVGQHGGVTFDILPPPAPPIDAAGSRDAFAVALAARVLKDGRFTQEGVDWAAAAWAVAATNGDDGVPEAMPRPEKIDEMLEDMRGAHMRPNG